jgi:hypothetical protein
MTVCGLMPLFHYVNIGANDVAKQNHKQQIRKMNVLHIYKLSVSL